MKYSISFKCNEIDYDYVIKKIIQTNTCILNTKHKNKEYYFITYEEDFNNLLKYDYKKVILFSGYYGLYNIINTIKYYFLYFIITLIIVAILFLSNYLVIKININTNKKSLKQSVKYYLMDNNIKEYSLKKDYKKIAQIKNKLLNKFNDEIEWIEISPNGYTYDVNIIERKKSILKQGSDKCNYVANKSGTITKIKATKGVLLVQENNYVNKGDILISGSIIYNNELKNEVCASGKIYGEVWYEASINYPLIKKYDKPSKKGFLNIKIHLFNKSYYIFKNKFENQKTKRKIGNNTLGISIISSSKIDKETKHISEEKGVEKALDKIRKNILVKSHNKSKIISQNILKKYVNNDTIYMKVLVTAEEELGVVESY